jgi:hypothetical protein
LNAKKINKISLGRWPISCSIGILIIIINWSSVLISISLAPPPFSPLTNYLSSLGNSTYNPRGAIIYNISVIISGFLYLMFFLGLFQWYTKNRKENIFLIITQVFGAILAFIIVLTGFFSEDFKPQHVFWSIIAGVFGFLVNLTLAYYLIRQEEAIKVVSYFIFGFMGFYIIFLFIISPQHVLTEWVVRIAGDINFILMIYNLNHIHQVRKKMNK